MKNIKIRSVKYNEFSLIAELTREAYFVPYKKGACASKPHEDKNVEDDFRDGKFFVLVAINENTICGAVRYKFTEDESVYIYNLAVLEEYRKRGIGKNLIIEVESRAREKGCKTSKLDCMQEKGLPSYYEKIGFVINEIKEHHDHHDVYMSKKLF